MRRVPAIYNLKWLSVLISILDKTIYFSSRDEILNA